MLNNQSDPSNVATIAINFDSMSLDTEPSGTSNKAHDYESRGNEGYENNPNEEVHAQSGAYGYD